MTAYNEHLRSLLEQHERDSKTIEFISRQHQKDFSLTGHIKSLLGMASTKESDPIFEASHKIRAVSDQNPNGLWVSLEHLARRDLTVGIPTAGGNTAGPRHDGGLIEYLRPASTVIGAGATLITGLKNGNLVMPRISSSVSTHWVAESAAPTESQQAFDQVVVYPRTLSVSVKVTRNLLKAASVNGGLESALRADIFNALMQEIDRVAIAGSDIGAEPCGLLNTAGIPVIAAGTNGAAPTWALMADMENEIASSRFTPGKNLSFVTNPAVRKKLRNTARGSGLDYIWADTDTIMGRPARVSESVPSNLSKGTSSGVCSAIAMGEWSDCIIGWWGPAAIDMIIDPSTFGKDGIVRIVALAEVGVGFRHPESFVICKDVLTA